MARLLTAASGLHRPFQRYRHHRDPRWQQTPLARPVDPPTDVLDPASVGEARQQRQGWRLTDAELRKHTVGRGLRRLATSCSIAENSRHLRQDAAESLSRRHERTFPRKHADPQTGAGRSRQRRLFGLTLRLE